jgi:dynein intermediate chain 1
LYEKYEKMKEQEDKPEVLIPEEVLAKPLQKDKNKIGLNTTEGSGEKERGIAKRILRSAKVLERMLNLNTFDEIAQDFRFWEDQSDEFKDVEGSLLPLWRFSFEAAKNLEITSLCWNPKYSDLFAAGFGSYDFYKQVCIRIFLLDLTPCSATPGLCLPVLPEESFLP